MMKMRTVLAVVLGAFAAATAARAGNCGDPPAASCLQQTVVATQVKFKPGTSSASYKGSAEYGMSYQYKLRAKKGQKMSVGLRSPGEVARFSLVAPDGVMVDEGFLVTNWSGALPKAGQYSIVVVMNEQDQGKVSYELDVQIK